MKAFYFFLALFICISSLTFAQPKKAEIFINGGVALPLSPKYFSDYWSTGYSIGGGAGYRFSPNITGSATLVYNSMAFNEADFLTSIGFNGLGISIGGADATIVMITANIKFSLVPKVSLSPYLIGGLGLFNLSSDNPTFSYLGQTYVYEGFSESAISAVFGAGIDIPVSPIVSVFLEVDWGIGFTAGDITGYVPAKGGLLILL